MPITNAAEAAEYIRKHDLGEIGAWERGAASMLALAALRYALDEIAGLKERVSHLEGEIFILR